MDLLFGKRVTGGGQVKAGTWIGSISLDASISEVHSETSEISRHPIEAGGSVVDNVRNLPRTVRIEGFITNTPIQLPGSQVDGVRVVDKEFQWKADPDIPLIQVGGPGVIGGVTGAISSAIGADIHKGSAKGFDPAFDRIQDVLAELDAIRKEKRIIDIVTTLRVYHNMVIESLEIPRDARRGASLQFTMIASQIEIVETATVAIPVPLVERGKPEKARGKQPGSEQGPDSATATAGKSVAANIVDSMGGWF